MGRFAVLSKRAERFLRRVREAQKHRKGRKGRSLRKATALYDVMATRMREHGETKHAASLALELDPPTVDGRVVKLTDIRWRQLYDEVQRTDAIAEDLLTKK